MRLRGRRPDPVPVGPGERVLASAQTVDGPMAGTAVALYLPGGRRIPWQEVEAAGWDADETLLRVREVGSWGEVRPEHRLSVAEPGRLLELLRERVMASIVLHRRFEVDGQRGFKVLGRRTPHGHGEIAWLVDYDAGLDPADPAVVAAVEAALTTVRREVGED
ncbi:hypothetical protein [Nocardioides sp. SYSU D00038]|uniref:hypothetical protein n=1 Tax=Nocardioides sp. SYSU D00038 TaxID=2812554 RepID=UPI001967E1FA|nr:hypothetical protein [Nocardioides sp. SYSU D00038]